MMFVVSAKCVLLCFLLAQAAAAPSGDRGKARAELLLHEGLDFNRKGQSAQALEKFQAAYAAYPSPKLWFNIGQVELILDHPVAAIAAFEQFIALVPDAQPEDRKVAKSAVAQLKKKLARLQINCKTTGAEVVVDGRSVGRLPLPQPLWVTPGTHQITIAYEGFVPATETVDTAAGTTALVVMRLLPTAPVAAPRSEVKPAAMVAGPAGQSRPPAAASLAPSAGNLAPEEGQEITICPTGMHLVDADHCCWPGQRFSPQRQTCQGRPACPPGMAAIGATCAYAPVAPTPPARVAEPAPPAATAKAPASSSPTETGPRPTPGVGPSSTGESVECPAGMRLVDSEHCCWPGQRFVPERQTCRGTPTCPPGMAASAGTCVLALTAPSASTPAAAAPAPSLAAVEPSQPAPPPPGPPSQPMDSPLPPPVSVATSPNAPPIVLDSTMNGGSVSEGSERLRLLERAQAARTTGLVFDLIGYGLVVVGGAISANQPDGGLGLSLSGSFVLTIGSVIGTSAYTVRQHGLTTAGYEVADSPQTTAWILTILSVGLTGGSVLLSVRAQDHEDFGLAMAAIGMGLGAGVLEVVNWAIREGSWPVVRAARPRSRTKPAAYGQVRLFPLLRPRVGEINRSPGWLLGLGGHF